MRRSGEEVTVDVKGRIIVGTTELSAKAAAQGARFAYVEAREARDLLASGALIRVHDDWTQPFEELALYYPWQRLPSATLPDFLANYPDIRLHLSEIHQPMDIVCEGYD